MTKSSNGEGIKYDFARLNRLIALGAVLVLIIGFIAGRYGQKIECYTDLKAAYKNEDSFNAGYDRGFMMCTEYIDTEKYFNDSIYRADRSDAFNIYYGK